MTFQTAALIEGREYRSAGQPMLKPVNPANAEALPEIYETGAEGADHAVQAAKKAFDDARWRDLAPWVRQERLSRLSTLIEHHTNSIATLDSTEMGKPIAAAQSDVAVAVGYTRYYAELLTKIAGELPGTAKPMIAMTRRVPRGVVAAITPWNFPFYCAVMKAIPALAAGNSVVLKPSELASQSALLLGQLALEAGVPPGVLNVVPGTGEITGRPLVQHADVDFVAFTGSTRTGKAILADVAASSLKATMMECGGKSPHILFADYPDLDLAADAIAADLLRNTGQVCSVGSRLIVERSAEARVIARIRSIFAAVTPGDPADPATTYGPVASLRQMEMILARTNDAAKTGACIVHGGTRSATPNAKGYYIAPCLIAGVSPDALIAREEIFGPVLTVLTVDGEAEAIASANATDYGLVGTVWTGDAAKGVRVGEAMRAASVRINCSVTMPDGPGFAWSGEPTAQSGYGAEGGLNGLYSYMRVQALQLCL